MKLYHIVTVIFVLINHGSDATLTKESRMFSLFNVVKFRNTACQSTDTANLQGICYTSQECSDKNGQEQGNCASGFGVCCIISVSTCGGQISENCTFIENVNYPMPVTVDGACTYTINRCSSDICQVRLDFLTGVLAQPTDGANAVCDGANNGDTLIITPGSTGVSFQNAPPALCGKLTGQHVYIDAGTAQTAATLAFNIGATGNSQAWQIKTSQIECSSSSRAPTGCLQYFTGASNTVTSFNWDGTDACATGCFFGSQDYRACFRRESGMCSFEVVPTTVTADTDSFEIHANANAIAAQAGALCSTTYIDIRTNSVQNAAATTFSNFCGNFMNALDLAIFSNVIRSNAIPFDIRVLASTPTFLAAPPAQDVDTMQNAQAGFSLDVTQVPCGQSYVSHQANYQ